MIEHIDKLNKLIAEADNTYGVIISSEQQTKRDSYKLGVIDGYNKTHEFQLHTEDLHHYLDGHISQAEYKQGIKDIKDAIK